MLRVAESSLDFALAHVESRGDTDILPIPFEYEAIRADWDSIRAGLAASDLDTWSVRTHRRCLVPKHGLGFRIVTQLDPFDTLVVTALVYEIGSDLEAQRLPKSEEIVHSYRFDPSPDGRMFSPQFNYESFRNRSIVLAREASQNFVVMTDVADFFPRLYEHVVENALQEATSQHEHVRVIRKLLSAWNGGVSYGIPVGPSVFRLIAEIAISDVDQALRSEGYTFCRFSDDYRLFVPTERQAHEALAFLANVLFKNHGLTLQESKTEIVSSDQFVTRFSRTERDQERHSLQDRFRELLEQLGIEGEYEDLEYEDLDPDAQGLIDSLNLWEIFREQLSSRAPLDIPLTRFVLQRIAQLGLVDHERLLLSDLKRTNPVFREVIEAVGSQYPLSEPERAQLGEILLGLFVHPVVGHLEYHRAWVLSLYAREPLWNHADELVRLYGKHPDSFTRRKIILALGRLNQFHWFKTWKQDFQQFSAWERRAFLIAASCLPGDEASHWYRSIRSRLDPLERAVVALGEIQPF